MSESVAARPRRGRRWLRRLLLAATAAVVLLVIAFVVVGALASRGARTVEEAWEADFGPWEETVARFPAREANATAQSVDGLAASIGIDTAPAGAAGRSRPSKEAAAALRAARGEMKPWLVGLLEDPECRVEPPPAEWVRFRAEHGEAFDALRTLLARGDVPRWERKALTEPEDYFARGSSDFFLGYLRVQEVLVGDALAALAAGDREGALLGLEAAWTHGRTLDDATDMLGALMREATLRLQVGALRIAGPTSETWDERLRLSAERGRLYEAPAIGSRRGFEDDGAMRRVLLETEEDGLFRRVNAVLLSPRLGLASWYSSIGADRARQVHVALRQHYPRCLRARDVSTALGGLRLEDDRWVPWAGDMAANLARAAQDVERLMRDAVFTRRVLQLERVRAATGAWPAKLPPFEADACPDLAWRYELHPDGGATLAFDPEIDWSERTSRFLLPERIDLAP